MLSTPKTRKKVIKVCSSNVFMFSGIFRVPKNSVRGGEQCFRVPKNTRNSQTVVNSGLQEFFSDFRIFGKDRW